MRACEPEWKRTFQWFPRFMFHLGFQLVRGHSVSWQEEKKCAGKTGKALFLLTSPAQGWKHGKATRQPRLHGCRAQGGVRKRENMGKKSPKKGQIFSKHFLISNICHSFSLQSLLMFIKVELDRSTLVGRVLGWNLRITSWQIRIFLFNL